jgi:hypothetical protein
MEYFEEILYKHFLDGNMFLGRELCHFKVADFISIQYTFSGNPPPPLYLKPNSNVMASSTLSRPLHILMASITHSHSLS